MSKRIVWVMLAVFALIAGVGQTALAQDRVQEEFHQSYQLSQQGRIQLENINGIVRVTGWDRNEVKVDAVKWAYTRERLDEAQIVVEPGAESLRIYTKYPQRNMDFRGDPQGRLNNPATVEYTLFVPRGVRVDAIEIINGDVSLEGLTGDIRASSINGNVTARGLLGEAKLSTINGNLEANFNQLNAAKPISLTSVNGNVTIILPSDASANLRANNVHGGITNDFGLPVRKGEYVGYDLAGQLGQGVTRIKLANVNGQITIRRANDGRAQSQATNLLTIREDARDKADKDKEGKEEKEEIKEAMREARAAQLEVARARADIARASRDAQRVAERATREALDANVAMGGVTNYGGYRLTERDSKSFPVSGTPRITVDTFDGMVNVRAWDKQEVSYTVAKRAADAENMQGIRISADQRGDEVIIRAEFDPASASRLPNVQAEASIDLFVPRQSNLRITSKDGRLNIEGVSGELVARTGDGAVDVRDSRGNLNVETSDGRIRISNFDGTAQAKTGDGGIMLDGRFTRLNASTGDGSISLSLPSDSNATIETDAEAVGNDGVATSEGNDETSRVRRWRVGSGGNLLTLKTGEGRILLRRSGGTQ
ncbi:MAG TPA: DUF4097 family beta strand repeat-containing protein [Pyrinomonadaceae bacterium]|nr:DUF4097 family beta strand repeat-containing protein [Pyrinomonadaceae bacterium]